MRQGPLGGDDHRRAPVVRRRDRLRSRTPQRQHRLRRFRIVLLHGLLQHSRPLPAKDPCERSRRREDPGGGGHIAHPPIQGRCASVPQRVWGNTSDRNVPIWCCSARGPSQCSQNLLAGSGRRRPQKGQTPIPDGSAGERNAPEFARRALTNRSVDAEAELEDLDLASRRGMDAAVYIMHMLGRTPDLPVTERFIAKVGRGRRGCVDRGT